MTLDQSALLGHVESLRTADGGDLMRRMLATMVQLLVDAEATAAIGAAPHERTATRTTHRNGTRGKTVCRRRPATSRCGFRSCEPARSSRRCWPRGGASMWRCTR